MYRYESSDEEEIEELRELWRHNTGFIYAKLRVIVEVDKDAVKMVMMGREKGEDLKEIVELNRKMLEEEICTDLEIRCGNGEIVKAHRRVLGGRSKVFKAMFQAEEMREARTGELEMEEMSEQGVKALLRWIYWKDEKEALLDSGVAVELMIAGDKWDLGGLVEKVREIILERRGYDEGWFNVESAVELLEWAEKLEGMKDLKEKAERVLQFVEKNFPEKLAKSKEYQDFLVKNDADTAMDWNSQTQNN